MIMYADAAWGNFVAAYCRIQSTQRMETSAKAKYTVNPVGIMLVFHRTTWYG